MYWSMIFCGSWARATNEDRTAVRTRKAAKGRRMRMLTGRNAESGEKFRDPSVLLLGARGDGGAYVVARRAWEERPSDRLILCGFCAREPQPCFDRRDKNV